MVIFTFDMDSFTKKLIKVFIAVVLLMLIYNYLFTPTITALPTF